MGAVQASVNNAQALIVDDDPVQRCLVSDCLQNYEFEVVEASSAIEAFERLKTLSPDIFILDVIMPGIDGFELCRQIRERRAFRHTPIVMITGLDDLHSIDKAFAAGATTFQAKPLNWNLLPHQLRFVLKSGQNEQRLSIALDEAKAADRAKTEFLANMSHELRTPLNAVIGFSEVLSKQLGTRISIEKAVEYLRDINSSGQHLLSIVNNVLDLSKAAAGEMSARIEPTSLSDILESTVQILGSVLHDKDIKIETTFDSRADAIEADEVRLRQVFLNIIGNAVKFSSNGSIVRLEAAVVPEGIRVTVADQGIGIAPDYIEEIRKPFRQQDSTLSREHEGTGLGLPLADSIVELHHGRIDIQSEVNVGTTVTVTLPRPTAQTGRPQSYVA